MALKLKAWWEKYPNTKLVFGTASDKEDSHFYRVCQDTARAAGMDPEKFWLHKFRATFCTWALQHGVDIRTVQHWAGHSSITMTERYLAPGQGAQSQSAINQAFNLNLGLEQMPVTAAAV